MEQNTYIMIKPDAVARGLIGAIVQRFENTGLKIERMEMGTLTAEQAAANYAEHVGKPFYEGLVSYITSGPVVKMVLSGPDAVVVCRKLMGATNPKDAAPGHHSRRLRVDHGRQRRARLGLARVGRARSRHLLRRLAPAIGGRSPAGGRPSVSFSLQSGNQQRTPRRRRRSRRTDARVRRRAPARPGVPRARCRES